MTLCDVAPSVGEAECASFFIAATGVDTVSLAWKPRNGTADAVEDADWWKMVGGRLRAGWVDHAWLPEPEAPERQCEMRPGAGGYVSKEKFAGGKLVVWPRARLVAVEGRLAALAAGDADAPGLVSVRVVIEAARRVAGQLKWLGLLEGSEPCSVRRLDLATDLRWDEMLAGRAVLSSLGSSRPAAGFKLNAWAGGHGTETVSLYELRGQKARIHGRVYDRGLKTGEAAYGARLRVERQLRWQGEDRPAVEVVAAGEWASEAVGWLNKLQPSPGAAASFDAIEVLLQRIESGEVARETGMRLLGALAASQRRDLVGWWREVGGSDQTRRKHVRELKALRVAEEAHSVPLPDLAELVEAMHEAWRAGSPVAPTLPPTVAP